MNNHEDFKISAREVSHIPVYLNEVTATKPNLNPLIYHINKYPLLQWADVYKFILQGTCGWNHLSKFGDIQQLKDYLERELNEAESPMMIDEFFELLDNRTELGRVNLRVWKYQYGTDIESLWNLIIKAEDGMSKEPDLFKERWSNLLSLVEEGRILFPEGGKKSLERWFRIVAEISTASEDVNQIPLISHSPLFRKTYKPSYRLVKKSDLSIFLSEFEKTRKQME
ncbi:MAG: hypothetical protein KAS63_02930 [Candidatus Heimdallarchaeota archaeon]|nr:hypothetical protein [Candidatus Heimdallarchaeota archaeon]MCK4954290.1 hypothetical protein [Candidatus Heimdallarchaeota archaeon]